MSLPSHQRNLSSFVLLKHHFLYEVVPNTRCPLQQDFIEKHFLHFWIKQEVCNWRKSWWICIPSQPEHWMDLSIFNTYHKRPRRREKRQSNRIKLQAYNLFLSILWDSISCWLPVLVRIIYGVISISFKYFCRMLPNCMTLGIHKKLLNKMTNIILLKISISILMYRTSDN